MFIFVLIRVSKYLFRLQLRKVKDNTSRTSWTSLILLYSPLTLSKSTIIEVWLILKISIHLLIGIADLMWYLNLMSRNKISQVYHKGNQNRLFWASFWDNLVKSCKNYDVRYAVMNLRTRLCSVCLHTSDKRLLQIQCARTWHTRHHKFYKLLYLIIF